MTEQIPPASGAPVPHRPPANWYADPGTPGQLRYWDGTQWTGNVSPVGSPAYAAPAAAVADPLNVPGGQPFVGFFRAIALAFKQYVKFSGRSSRSEYWWWYLFHFLVAAVVLTPGYIQYFQTVIPAWRKFLDCLDTNINNVDGNLSSLCKLDMATPWLLWVGVLVMLPLLLPSLGVLIRRLHDTGRSGWWMWISLIPVAGSIILIVWLATDSKPEPNQYGMPPRKGEPVAGSAVPSS
jgi:uncharacterized membrane protein YhaH (DUF805 family)